MKRFFIFSILFSIAAISPFYPHINVQKAAQSFRKKYPHFSSEKRVQELVTEINTFLNEDKKFQKLSPALKKKVFRRYLYSLKSEYPELFKELGQLQQRSTNELLSFSALGALLPWTMSFINAFLILKFVDPNAFSNRGWGKSPSKAWDALVASFVLTLPYDVVLSFILPFFAHWGDLPPATVKEFLKPLAVGIGTTAFSCLIGGLWNQSTDKAFTTPERKFVEGDFYAIETVGQWVIVGLLGYLFTSRYLKEVNSVLRANDFIEICTENFIISEDGNSISFEVA